MPNTSEKPRGKWSSAAQILILFILLVIVLQTFGYSPAGLSSDPPSALRTYGFEIKNQTGGLYLYRPAPPTGDIELPAPSDSISPGGTSRYEVIAKWFKDTSVSVVYNVTDAQMSNLGILSFKMSVYGGINTKFDSVETDAPIKYSESYGNSAHQLIIRNN
ncbi:hypothetical protein M3223_02425 [Paenibacillus pasadenensis]|uniref:hypothetical protein n=1 Tax=Paenibacillus pasadenensis TaxID=217090 RepID=UPI00203C2E38|nr:hypothetical protein [Paenibacillus pasadenensis]MCM3746205.1 hypothetical protein [Paenibacillus pasadenensis]